MKVMPDLPEGEAPLWFGRPHPTLRFGMGALASGIFAGAMLLAALGVATVVDRTAPGLFWVILAPAVVIAVIIVMAGPVWQFIRDRRTSYVLTNKRALIIGAQNPRAFSDQMITSGDNIVDLIAHVVNATSGVFIQETLDR